MKIGLKKSISFIKIQYNLIILMFISCFFYYISFGSIGTLSLTIPFIVAIIYFLVSIYGICIGKLLIDKKILIYYIAAIIIFLLNYIFSFYDSELTSFLLYIFYFSLLLLKDPRIDKVANINKILKIFVVLASIFSIYAVYQFIAYNFLTVLPLKELIPEILRTQNYNTLHYTSYLFNGRNLLRAHSIYVEASYLSQFSGIAILFLLIQKKDYTRRKFYILLIINLLGMAVSLSGTGFIVLICGLLFMFLSGNHKTKFKFLVCALVVLLLFIPLSNSTFIGYYLNRLSEFSLEGGDTSGYYRFILPFKIGFDSLKNGLFGYGFGNDDIAFSLYNSTESRIGNGFGKIFVEVGPLGLIAIIAMFIIIRPNRKYKKSNPNLYRLYIVLVAVAFGMNIVGTFMTVYFWPFLLIASFGKNYHVKDKEKVYCYEKNTVNNDTVLSVL